MFDYSISSYHHNFDYIWRMSLRTRLIVFVLLFGSAVLTNIFALVYLTRSISNSLGAIENVRQRQLVAIQMNAHLRDAEATPIFNGHSA